MKLTTLLFATLLFGTLEAATTSFGTGLGGIEFNDYGGANVATIPDPAWHAPIGPSVWESIQPDSTSPAIPNGTTVDFFFMFTLGTPVSGNLSLLVDDNAKIVVNGVVLYDNTSSPLGEHCAASLPNCMEVMSLDIGSYLVSGVNKVQVSVRQAGNGPFGLDVFGTAQSTTSNATPEPSSMVLMIGGGLVFITKLSRRKSG
jgi:hypothetical protein